MKEQITIVNDSNIFWFKKTKVKIVEGLETQQLMSINEAYSISQNSGLDLIIIKQGTIINGNEIPSIGKILDYNKYLYEQKKHEKELAKKQRAAVQKVKEVKFHIGIDIGDYNYKINHIKEFIEEGDKVNCQVVLRGREKMNKDLINKFVEKLKEDCKLIADFERPFNNQGSVIFCLLTKKKN